MMLREVVVVSAASFSLGACSALAVNCSDVGCISGLIVSFATPPTGSLHVEVTSPTSPTPRVYDCANAPQCSPVATFGDYMPATAIVTVTYAGRTTTTEVHPVYEAQYPNGRACGAACTSATVTLPLP
jgi:hypothetical protein